MVLNTIALPFEQKRPSFLFLDDIKLVKWWLFANLSRS
jgi:hypothetical protein